MRDTGRGNGERFESEAIGKIMNNPYFEDLNEKGLESVRHYFSLPESERGAWLADRLKPRKNVGNARNSVVTKCRDCKISGVNLPGNHECGNCGSFNTFII